MKQHIIVFILFVGIPFLVAHFVGRKRYIGFGWSFYFGLFFPFGLLATFLSRSKSSPPPKPEKWKKIVGIILIIIGILGFIKHLVLISKGAPMYGIVGKVLKKGIFVQELGFVLGMFADVLFLLPLGVYLYSRNKIEE